MKNPTSFSGATPYSRWQPTDKTMTGRSEGKSSNSRGHAHPTRDWKMAASKSMVTPDKEAIDPIGSSTQTHPGLSTKMPMSPGFVGDGKMMGAPKTGEKTFSQDPVDSRPVKWHKKGYTMETPSSEGSGKARKKP